VLESQLQCLSLEHVECDEIWTFCRKKQARLTVEERETCFDAGDIYLFTAMDQETKLVAAHVVGKQTADNALRLMMTLARRVNLPKPGSGDDHAFTRRQYEPVIQISSDGFARYPEAVDLAFGPFAKFGTIVKDYRNAEQPGRYAPAEIVGTDRRAVFNMESDEIYSICTSHIERNNLTIRTLMRRFTRLALGFSKKLENLEAAINLHMAYYNFCWRSRYPDDSGRRRRFRPTAAMMAGVTERLWSFNDLMNA
jgi:IS1 family transposase